MAEVLLHPLGYWHYEQNPAVSGSSEISTLRVYKHPTGGDFAHKCAVGKDAFAILVSFNPTDADHYSKIYIGRPCLDFRLDKVHGLLIFKKMRCLGYSSSLVKGSENDILRHLDPEGGPDRLDWIIEDLELSPKVHKGRHGIYLF